MLQSVTVNGDININYLLQSVKKSQLQHLVLSYNLSSIINFPTRIKNNSATATDMFLDISQFENCNIIPLLNGLSDRDVQLVTINLYHSYIP
jgi:hypothetical protein